ncbi:signal peptide peptidase SppA [Jiella sp. MQZ9-1]|uniref:Signal peptide peptidase SppA n=1 Tax=Jiella flava TaxID=2816857 RepID=A0A939FWL3_9HYPH|nr:signal peptide peptidase SppA [Jiella flava]MBO0661510.1 signal peptide peptidase SppA [Jiella flava]MCD2470152.1 signal peptide peptidase SppA [Jiella flava]
MVNVAGELIDRRRLRRKLSFWRIIAVAIAVVALIAVPVLLGFPGGDGASSGDQIARVSIEGMILEDQDLLDLLKELKREDNVKAVVLRIDSPGGTTVGGESIYEAVRDLAKTKPVVAEVGTLAASAAYMIAIGTDHIVARRTSIVGSIGVLFQYVNAGKLLDTVGVEVNAIKSAPLKAEPSPFGPAPAGAEDMIRRLVMDTYEWFVGLVAQRRDMSLAKARELADGSIFTGHQGLQNKLVDELGGEEAVRHWLETQRKVSVGLKIVDREPKSHSSWSLLGSARSALFGFIGLDQRAENLQSALMMKTGRLDGLVSLWQPFDSQVRVQ